MTLQLQQTPSARTRHAVASPAVSSSIVTDQPARELTNLTRSFRVASSLARLISLEREGSRVAEGYFPAQADQSLSVRLQESIGQLLLIPSHQERSGEQVAEIPLSQAEALLAVTAGQVGYVQTAVPVGSSEAKLMRFATPGPLDLITKPEIFCQRP